MQASAVQHPAALRGLPVTVPLLRLRSDEQLLAHFRAGNDEAFGVLHDRYRQRLFAYVRQMLASASRQDAEDVMQDVFVRAYGGLRADGREMNVRAWLYRVAHNRCIDHLRRPVPPPAEVYEVSRKPVHDPVEEAQRREDLSRLVQDIARLPEQQRSALLMRELDGMSYADLASALDVTVPAVKSLLVRARVGLVDAAEARDAACEEIRDDLMRSYDRGVKASSRARRHLRTCRACTDYRAGLRGMRRSFAALSPVGIGPVALGAKLLGLGGGGAAAGGTAAAGGSAAGGAVAATGAVTACKVAAVVCTAAIAGSAVEAKHYVATHHKSKAAPRAHAAPPAPAAAPVAAAPAATHSFAAPAPPVVHPTTAAPARTKDDPAKPDAASDPELKPDPPPADLQSDPNGPAPDAAQTGDPPSSGGTPAPDASATPPTGADAGGTTTAPSPPAESDNPVGTTAGTGRTGASTPPADSATPSSTGAATPPPATHDRP